MRSFSAFFKKELLESIRSGKLLFLTILFCLFGIMNPAIAKLTPLIFNLLSEELSENGMTIVAVEINALTSWTQFFKNIPMALIAFVLIYGNIFTKEYEKDTLILVLTKGLARHKVVLSKATLLFSFWTVGYWLCFFITYAYNDYYWSNSIAKHLFPAAFHWWLFGIFVLCLILLFSVICKNYASLLLCTGACVLLCYLLGLLPQAAPYMPTSLMNSAALLVGTESASDHLASVFITAALSFFCIFASIPIFNKKQL